MEKIAFTFLFTFIIYSGCSKKDEAEQKSNVVSETDKELIANMGFSTDNIVKIDNGFLVEGDIYIGKDQLDQNDIRGGKPVNAEYYLTPLRVTGLPRHISIYLSGALHSKFVAAADAAIARYNAQPLRITFGRISSAANATIIINSGPVPSGHVGVSGFPSGGNPYSPISLNTPLLSGWKHESLTTVITHLLGHAIGFLHTDLPKTIADCIDAGTTSDYAPYPYGGAIHIPGLASKNSWMSVCLGSEINKPFNSSDSLILGLIYGL